MATPGADPRGSAASGLDRPTRITLAAAAAWAVGLVVAALTLPLYGGHTSSRTTRPVAGNGVGTITTFSHATLVQVNGYRVLPPIAAPAVAVAVVAAVLSHRRRAHKPGPGAVAITVLAVIGAGTLAAILTVGIFAVPVDVLLLVACVRSSSESPGPRRNDAPSG